MSAGRRRLCVGWLALQLLLIVVVSLHDLASILPGDRSVLPQASDILWRKVESFTSLLLGRQLGASNPIRQGIAAYTNGAGIDLGYSYFAPSVSENSKLIFELHYPDGHVGYDLPHVGGAAAGYRVAALLDNLQHASYPPLRRAIVQTLVASICLEHPDAVIVRAIIATANLPGPTEFRAGSRPTYKIRYAYEFRVRAKVSESSGASQ